MSRIKILFFLGYLFAVGVPANGQSTICPAAYPIVISIIQPIGCHGDEGIVQVSVPSAPNQNGHRIEWSHDGSTSKTKTLSAGEWEFTYSIVGQSGCYTVATFTMTEPDKIDVNGTVKSALTCSDQNYIPGLSGPDAVLQVNPSGGLNIIGGSPVLYKVDWDHNFTDNPVDNPTSFISGDYEIFGKPSGAYYVAVSDVNNCVGVDTIIVFSNTTNISITASPVNPSCSGANGSVSIAQITPGNTYEYHLFETSNPLDTISSNYTGSFQNLSISEYEIHAISPQNCRGTQKFDIEAPAPLQVSLESKEDVKCYGEDDGSISLRVLGGTKPYKVYLNRSDHASVDNISSSNNEVNNFNYKLQAGSYYLYVQDQNGVGCISDSIYVDILESSPASSGALSISKSITNACFLLSQRSSGEITVSGLDGNGPYEYALFNRGNDYTGYRDRWRPASSWSWEVLSGTFNTTGEFTSLFPGTYTIAVRDNYGCERRSLAIIGINPQIGVQISTSSVQCYGDNTGSVQATATGGFVAPLTYTLLPENITQPTGLFSNLPARNSGSIRVTDSRGCQSSLQTFDIYEPSELVISFEGMDPANCNPGQGILHYEVGGGNRPYGVYVNDDLKFSTWNNNFAISLDQGTYNVKVIDAYGCEVEDVMARTITGPATPGAPPNSSQGLTASVSAINHALCHGDEGSVEITISGGWPTALGYEIKVYKWIYSPTAQSASYGYFPDQPIMTILTKNSPHTINLPKGEYQFEIFDGEKCMVTVFANIIEPAPIVPTFAGFTGNCGPSSSGQSSGGVTLSDITGGTPPFDYRIDGIWYNSTTTPFPNFFPNMTLSTISMEIHDQHGCVKFYP